MAFHLNGYSNFHDDNQDWIVSKIKSIEDTEAHTEELAEAAQASADASRVSAEASQASANASQASAEASQLSADAAQESAETAQESAENAEETVANTLNQVNLLQARVDNIIPQGTQTEGNTELLDIRVGFDGTIYNSAGDSVRGQVSALHTLEEQFTGNTKYKYTRGKYFDLSGTTVDPLSPSDTASSIECVAAPCSGGDWFQLTAHSAGPSTLAIAFVDSSNNILLKAPQALYNNITIRAPENSAYVVSNNYYSDTVASLVKNEYLVKRVKSNYDNLSAFTGIDLYYPNKFTYYTISGSTVDPLNPNIATTQKVEGGYVPCTAGDVFYITAYSPGPSSLCYGFVDANNNVLLRSTNASFNNKRLVAPKNSAYLVFNNLFDLATLRLQKGEYIDKQINAINALNNYGAQLFNKIGVIGDSISVGWAKDKNGNNSRRNTVISWPQQMARRLGCTAYNLGASGVDPIEWFQPNYEFAQYCYEQYNAVGYCDLYIIGLGLNQGTLGTIADIDQTDYTNNAQTFYGQYARIIQMINDEHPNAIVVCLTEPTSNISAYDQAVRDICGLSYINAILLDLENDYFDLFNTPEILAEHQPDGLHFTPYGYSLIAEAMVTTLNDYIKKHTTEFKYVGVAAV